MLVFQQQLTTAGMKAEGKMSYLKSAILLVSIAIVSGCSGTRSYSTSENYDKPLYGKIAKKLMEYEGPARNPVIVIHGFMGAKLRDEKNDQNVWGYFTGVEALGIISNEQLRGLSHPMGLGKPLKELRNDVKATGLLDQVKIRMMGMVFHLDAYDGLINILTQAGYYPESKPLPPGKHFYSQFVFYYDWRRDLPENAARLHQFTLEKRAYLQKEYEKLYGLKNFDVQFDIVAHSMGGLLSRYYLRYGDQDLPADGVTLPKLDWKGSKFIDKLIIVGTPNGGYLDTCIEMINGLNIGGPVFPPGVVATFPTYYQMMPVPGARSVLYADNTSGPEVDMFDPNVWIAMNWGLVNTQQDEVLKITLPNVTDAKERRKIAIDHLTKCLKRAKQFISAMNADGTPPNDVALFLFLGDAAQTNRTVVVDRKNGSIKVTETEPGDGKILASSARYDKRESGEWVPFFESPIRWTAIYHLSSSHMGLTNSVDFANNATFLLLIFPTPKQEETWKTYKYLVKPVKL